MRNARHLSGGKWLSGGGYLPGTLPMSDGQRHEWRLSGTIGVMPAKSKNTRRAAQLAGMYFFGSRFAFCRSYGAGGLTATQR
jgi:hypothetical protein